jgi:hypothetical protein
MSRIPTAVRQAVLERDHHRCLAPQLDDLSGQCRDRFGRPTYEVPEADLELDHIRPGPMMGKEPPSIPAHLVTLCGWHHQGLAAGRNWATSHRPLLRAYLARKAKSTAGLGTPLQLDLAEAFPADDPPARKREFV